MNELGVGLLASGVILPVFGAVFYGWTFVAPGPTSGASMARSAPYVYAVVLLLVSVVAAVTLPASVQQFVVAPTLTVWVLTAVAPLVALGLYFNELYWSNRATHRSTGHTVGGEAQRGAADVARSPVRFAVLAIVTALCEELLFRGVLLGRSLVVLPVVVAIVLQAALFGFNHLTFGRRSAVSKTAAGLAWGAMALSGSLVPSAVSHLVFQWLVFRRYARVTNRREVVHVSS